jgi:hypothetical protein
MFFTECANLAERHPDLASVFEQLDSQLGAMGTAEVIRHDDMASFLNIDPNRIHSALDLFAQVRVLGRVEMIECRYCQMAVHRSDYQAALAEDGEYRCTDCDRPLTDRTIKIIKAYQRGEKWRAVSNLRDDSGEAVREASASTTSSNVMLDEQGFYGHDRLAEFFKLDKESLRKRLDRYRVNSLDGWQENADRRPRKAKYLYQLRAIRPIVEELRASSERPAK